MKDMQVTIKAESTTNCQYYTENEDLACKAKSRKYHIKKARKKTLAMNAHNLTGPQIIFKGHRFERVEFQTKGVENLFSDIKAGISKIQ